VTSVASTADMMTDLISAEKLLSKLENNEYRAFLDDFLPQFSTVKKTGSNKQIAAIEKILDERAIAREGHQNQEGRAGTLALASQTLHVDVNSAIPTPTLTMEPNSPQSSSPPSTGIGAAAESVEHVATSKTPETDSTATPTIIAQND
jgi:mRNA-binding protein PUF3